MNCYTCKYRGAIWSDTRGTAVYCHLLGCAMDPLRGCRYYTESEWLSREVNRDGLDKQTDYSSRDQ